MINIVDKKNCCGCTACYSICPKRAISMQEDEEGFLYPIVNKEICIKCGMCDRVCAFDDEYVERFNIGEIKDTKAAFSQNPTTRRKSRSGGVFYELARSIIEDGGVVFGVGFDDAFNVITMSVTEMSRLSLLQGSKYVQSDKRNSFAEVKNYLAQGKTVLFSGTACEVAGLKSYLMISKTNQEKLIACDMVCHGTPSPMLWRKQIEHIKRKRSSRLDGVDFRDKSFGWRPHIESYHFDDGKTIYENRFTSLFCERVSLRPACGACHYCSIKRLSDITLADGWGITSIHPELDVSQGISFLMVNTDKGDRYLKEIDESLMLYTMPLPPEQLQPNLYHPSTESSQRKEFWGLFASKGFEISSNKFYSVVEKSKVPYNLLRRKLTMRNKGNK